MAQRLATVRACWTADRSRLVADNTADARVLAYPVGDPIADADVEAYDLFLSTLEPKAVEPLTAEWPVWTDEDGGLVHEGDPAAAELAYVVGEEIAVSDADAYLELGPPPVKAESGLKVTKEGPKPANKMRNPAADKTDGGRAATVTLP